MSVRAHLRAKATAVTARWPEFRAFAMRAWHLGHEVELLQRSMAFAALFFVTLVPLLVVIAAASTAHGSGISRWVTDALGLSGEGASSVQRLFVSQRQILSATTVFGLASLAVFGISLMASVQGAYERIWRLSPGPWHNAWRQATGLAGLIGYILLAAFSGSPWRHTAAQPTLRVLATVIGGIALFWWLPHLLLASRASWRELLPGSLATIVALAGLQVFSRLVFAPLLVTNAVSYGTVGTVLVVQSWLIGVGYSVYLGAIVGRSFIPHPRRSGRVVEEDTGDGSDAEPTG
ncbi:YhjD/YihY/BrkB family envelope integrity protein [Streptacidiphilus rugosus]|uniref:YhjD/YihY/BrkB family envelope integrity protein n=1 Tax=Streptacidiphilus rugosus TaxID=405783 RepID=UPI0012F81AD6|nr:YhjD/YihY/BrkB family envelope integrity protein [Streptacidiphilus rugosus]